MGVMTQMRDRAAVILFILLVLFVLSMTVGGLVGGANILDIITGKHPDAIGIVNGKEIKVRTFNEAYTNQLENYRNRTGNEPTESQLDFIRNQVWDSLVRDILIQQVLRQEHIKASDAEIVYRIFNDPPDILRSNPAFQNDQKQFDMAKYQAALNDPSLARQWRPVEDLLRATLPYEELQDRIVSSVRVTDDEVKREFLKQNQKVTVNYIFYDLQKYADPKQEITEESIENYYKSHSDEFQEEEKRKIQYVIFPKTATPQDSAAKWELARSLVERAKEGEDFAELAEIYSEDPGSRDKGGELGFFGRGSMVKPFEEAAFAAKVGEVVGPVQSNFGLHVIKVEDKKIEKGQEQVKASHILIKFGASRNTIERARDDANYFIEDATEKSFEQLAQENKLQIDTTNFFPKGSGFVPGIGLNKKASNFIFNNEAGRTGDVVETPQGFIVYKIAKIQKRRTKPLETVKSIIRNKLLLQKRLALAAEKAQQAYDQIQSGLSFQEAAHLDSLKVTKTEPFSRTDFVPNVGRDSGFIGAAFSLNNPNDVTKPVKGTRGYYLIQLVEKTEADSTAFEAQKASLAQQLLQRKRTQVYASWYEALKARADIKDYRDRFF